MDRFKKFISSEEKVIDYDEEGRNLLSKLNLDASARSGGMWNPLDPIWRHPEGGGTIYIGNQSAAENLSLLKSKGITHVSLSSYQ